MTQTIGSVIATINKARGTRDEIAKRVAEEKALIRALMDQEITIEKTQTCVETVAQRVQERLRYRVTETVSYALAYVFDDPCEFDVQFSVARGRSEAHLTFLRNGRAIPPIGAEGGGAVDVGSIAMRFAMFGIQTSISPGSISPIMVLDEPFKNVNGEEENKRAWRMLRRLSQKIGIQVIVVTQEGARGAADRVFRMSIIRDSDGDRVTKVDVEDIDHAQDDDTNE